MILYHFTTITNAEAIHQQGLMRGRVDLSHDPQDYVHAISLTSSPTPVGLGIDQGSDTLTDDERRRYYEQTGAMPPPGAKFADFTAVRITLNLERADFRLVRWFHFRKRILPSRLVQLEQGCNPSTWWVYLGRIPPRRFQAFHSRHGKDYREDEPS